MISCINWRFFYLSLFVMMWLTIFRSNMTRIKTVIKKYWFYVEYVSILSIYSIKYCVMLYLFAFYFRMCLILRLKDETFAKYEYVGSEFSNISCNTMWRRKRFYTHVYTFVNLLYKRSLRLPSFSRLSATILCWYREVEMRNGNWMKTRRKKIAQMKK